MNDEFILKTHKNNEFSSFNFELHSIPLPKYKIRRKRRVDDVQEKSNKCKKIEQDKTIHIKKKQKKYKQINKHNDDLIWFAHFPGHQPSRFNILCFDGRVSCR